MPRRKKPHQFEVVPVPFDPLTPFHLRRALYTRLSNEAPDDDVSHTVQQFTVQNVFGLTQALPLPAGEGVVDADKYGHRGPDRGYVVTKIYRDWRTGVDQNRLAMKQLIKDAHAGEHAGVLFRDDDRLFRDTGVLPLVNLWQGMQKAYGFEAALGVFSIEDWAIHAHMSGREREKTRQRTTNGRRARAARGEAMHTKLPYWLQHQGTGIELVEERAECMREAIRKYAAGVSPMKIATWLTTTAPIAGESKVWTTARLRLSLRNPALWGRLDYGRHKVLFEIRDGERYVTGRTVNPDAVPFEVPALVHRTELERTQCRLSGGCERDELPSSDALEAMIKANKMRNNGRPISRAHPLRKRVVCACHWRMAYQPKWYRNVEKPYGYLTCCRHQQRGLSVSRNMAPCATPRVRTTELWPKVRALVEAAIAAPEIVVQQAKDEILAVAATEARTNTEDAAVLAEIAQDLADLDARENRLYERWDTQKPVPISQAVYEGQTRKIAADRLLLEERKRQILDRERILAQAAAGLAQLRAGLTEAQGLDFERLSLEQWSRLFDDLVADVVLDAEGTPSIHWRTGDVDLAPVR